MNSYQRRKERRRQERRKDAKHVKTLMDRAQFWAKAHEEVSGRLAIIENLSFLDRVKFVFDRFKFATTNGGV